MTAVASGVVLAWSAISSWTQHSGMGCWVWFQVWSCCCSAGVSSGSVPMGLLGMGEESGQYGFQIA